MPESYFHGFTDDSSACVDKYADSMPLFHVLILESLL